MACSLFFLCFCLIVVCNSVGQTETFGHLIYTVPSGWDLKKYQNGIQMTKTGLPEKELVILQILPPLHLNGTLQQALEKSYDETCASLQVIKMHEVNGQPYNIREQKKSFRGWDYIRCSGGIKVNNGTPYPVEYGLDMLVLKINERFERIAIVKSRNLCGGLSSYYPSDRLGMTNTIENFLFSIRFTDWREPDFSNGKTTGGGITGVWQGISLTVGTPKPGAELGAELRTMQLIFFPNGQAYFGKNFPVEGLDEINTGIMAENNRRDWGTYEFKDGRGTLMMPYGNIPLRMDNNRLILTTNNTDHGYMKQNAVDGAKFNGTYVLGERNGMIPAITFTPDGKFADRGALRVLYHEYTDCLNPALLPGSGTYQVRNHTIIFNYSDGRIIRLAFTGNGFEKNSLSPTFLILSFNEDKLIKKS